MASSILVINDDQSILELFHLILESEGYEVSSSLVVYEDVKDVEQLNPALIILDVRIGYHAEGLLLLQKLKMYPPTKDIPVIICTAALSEMREQEETLRQKKIPVLYKPFDMDELLKLVHQFLPAPSLDQLEVTALGFYCTSYLLEMSKSDAMQNHLKSSCCNDW